MTNPDLDPFKLSSPRIYLFRMLVFLLLAALLVFILQKQIQVAFLANPGLNAVIIAVLAIGDAFLGLGLGVVELALVVLAFAPIVTNAYLGVVEVDPELVDAARGMGMSEWEILRRVELPLAVPLDSVAHYEDYLKRLKQVPRAFADTEEVLKAGMRDQLMPVRYLLEKVPAQCEGVIKADPFLLPIEKFPASVPPEEQARLARAITDTVNNGINSFIFVLKRGNYMVPVRAQRSFPLADA